MTKKIFFALITVVLLAACGNDNAPDQDASENGQNAESEASLQPLEVEILTESEAFEPGEAGDIEILVTQGDENVSDAKDVQFEIWKQGHEEESEKFEPENAGNGNYTLTHTFDEEGIYYVVTHVTARNMHSMPKKELIVGDVEESNKADENDQEEHSHDQAVTFHLMEPEAIHAGDEKTFTVHLEKDGKPLTEADVSYEFWKAGEEKHEFIDTEENEEGEYEADLTFASAGEYQLTIHVKKDELHEHKENTINVQ
ncbi:FixH family protein [Bacillus piscicola]|uniref:FixH family protein n=1 Tax=Bacillus piscicola TaxID=1632684 RepID=UPI001F08D48E|nr:FixH family protein [Bacillus piscicola]